jgi:hypothetical protein
MTHTIKTVCASRSATRKRKLGNRELGLDYEKTFATAWEKQLRDDIDRGYRYFHEQRGNKPPRVSKDVLFY